MKFTESELIAEITRRCQKPERQEGDITVRDVMAAKGVGETTARRWLNSQLREGFLETELVQDGHNVVRVYREAR